jgi:hypothetical protein
MLTSSTLDPNTIMKLCFPITTFPSDNSLSKLTFNYMTNILIFTFKLINNLYQLVVFSIPRCHWFYFLNHKYQFHGCIFHVFGEFTWVGSFFECILICQCFSFRYLQLVINPLKFSSWLLKLPLPFFINSTFFSLQLFYIFKLNENKIYIFSKKLIHFSCFINIRYMVKIDSCNLKIFMIFR